MVITTTIIITVDFKKLIPSNDSMCPQFVRWKMGEGVLLPEDIWRHTKTHLFSLTPTHLFSPHPQHKVTSS